VFYSRGLMVLEDVKPAMDIPGFNYGPGDSAVLAKLKVFSKTSSIYTLNTIMVSRGGQNFAIPDTVMPENLILQLQKTEGDRVELGVKESSSILEYVTLKAYKFPYINLVWGGTIIM